MSGHSFRLNRGIDAEGLAAAYARDRRLHIAKFLDEEDAERLYLSLKARDDWRLVLNQDDKLFELERATQTALTADEEDQLAGAVYKAARYGFQFQFETIRVSDGVKGRLSEPTLLNLFAAFLSSEPVSSLLRSITEARDIAYADAQATAYGLNHFLTAHDDDVEGKNGKAAYVFNLTPA